MVLYSSHGRGGVGNMADKRLSPPLTAADLVTPTVKTAVYSTGRGGSGNMARNTDPLETRMRQDVEEIPRRRFSGSVQHSGRGGAGNIVNTEDLERAEIPHMTLDTGESLVSGSERRRSTEVIEKAKAFFRK
ncbi:hypothetical protein Cpir12675_000756 [Ceratocystis pirilliformis]|uniref:Uncharacterized protein n=1 Tax=Ceratocystis pirilliformis TaxID=259994 RepID=A0ABR3ZK29_9PEZI